MNRLGILAHQATELMGCTEDTVSLEDAAATIAYCEKVESGELPLIADEIEHPTFTEFCLNRWIEEGDMTDQEKINSPEFHTRGGDDSGDRRNYSVSPIKT